jgi:hypothetical protein
VSLCLLILELAELGRAALFSHNVFSECRLWRSSDAHWTFFIDVPVYCILTRNRVAPTELLRGSHDVLTVTPLGAVVCNTCVCMFLAHLLRVSPRVRACHSFFDSSQMLLDSECSI